MSDETITIREAKLLAFIAANKPTGSRLTAYRLMEEPEWVQITTKKLMDMGLVVKFDLNPAVSKLLGAPLVSSYKAARTARKKKEKAA